MSFLLHPALLVRRSVRPSVGPSVRPSVGPVLFSKVKITHTRRILCRVSGLVSFISLFVDAGGPDVLTLRAVQYDDGQDKK